MRNETVLFLVVVLAIVVLGGVLALGVLFPNGLSGGGNSNYITVTASGSAFGYPTQALVYLEVNGSGATTQVATANLSLSLAQLNQTLLMYTTTNQITTESYSLGRPYNSTDYVAAEGLEAVLPSINSAAAFLGAISVIKGVYVNSVNLQLTANQMAQLRNEALSLAMANATQQAQATLGNRTAITLHNVSVNNYVVYPYPVFAGITESSPTSASGPEIFAGREQVTESVSAIFSYSR